MGHHHHHHRGKTLEGILDTDSVLATLQVKPGQTVLDAGCGNGYMSKVFSGLVTDSGRVYALDSDDEAIALLKAETEGTNLEALVGDITQETALPAGSIDLIYLSTVFHGFTQEQIEGFNTEIKRLLGSNAMLAVVEMQKKQTGFGPPLHIRFSPEELIQAVDLTPEITIELDFGLYLQTFRNN